MTAILLVQRTNRGLRYETNLGTGAHAGPIGQGVAHRLSASELRGLMMSADRLLHGDGGENFADAAKTRGQVLYSSLLPREIQDILRELRGPLLISTSVYGLPWELLHDGSEFFGMRFALGKQIITDRRIHRKADATPRQRQRALIIGSNPLNDLPLVRAEGEMIQDLLSGFADIRFLSGPLASFDAVTTALQEGFDLVHFAGHIRSGPRGGSLVLADGQELSANLIEQIVTGQPVVFLNGCSSLGRGPEVLSSRREELFAGVASGFLFAGAAGVVGTLVDPEDQHAADIAAAFYRRLLQPAADGSGPVCLGEALREARASYRQAHPNSPVWLSFVLYGDPSLVFRQADKPHPVDGEVSEPSPAARPAPPPSAFRDDGSLNGEKWHHDAVRILSIARAEAHGRSEEQAGVLDVMVALVDTQFFANALALWRPGSEEEVPKLLIQLLRRYSGSRARAPARASPIRRQQLTDETQSLIGEIATATRAELISVSCLLRGVLDSHAPEIEALFDEVGIAREPFLQAVRKTEAASAARQTAEEPAPMSAPPTAQAAVLPRAAVAPGDGEPIFDAQGRLRPSSVTAAVAGALAEAAADAADVKDGRIEPLHLFVALACGPALVQRTEVESEVPRRLLRAALFNWLGKKLQRRSDPQHPMTIQRASFSAEALALIDQAAIAAPRPLDWPPLFEPLSRQFAARFHLMLRGLPADLAHGIDRLFDAGERGPAPRPDTSTPSARGADQPSPVRMDPRTPAHGSALVELGRDLTADARAGLLAPTVGRDAELRQVTLALARKDKASVLLIGPAGVGKTAIVEGLAQRIVADTATDVLRHRRLIQIDPGRLISGASHQGQLEGRMQAVMAEAEADPAIILFLDEFHSFVNMGGHGERTGLTIGNQLKTALGRGKITVIAVTTEQEFAQSVERDPALLRRFRLIRVAEPSPEDTLEILRRTKTYLETKYQIAITDDALVTAVRLAIRHLPGHLPDKARDLVVDACAERLLAPTDRPRAAIDAAAIVDRITEATGIRPEAVSVAARDAAASLEAALRRHVVGQEQAIACVADRLSMGRVVRNPRRPVAVLFFCGPTGVGKTELAKAIARECCGGADALTVIPMNEYGERVAVSKLLGVGPGWVGHDDQPVLTATLRRRPNGVILFDEIEKADAEVCKVLMRLFDEGVLSDGARSEINGRDAIFIMTSNLVPERGRVIGFGSGLAAEESPRRFLLGHFAAEFLNRVDDIVVFRDLGPDAIERIIARNLDALAEAVRRDHGVEVRFSEAIAAWLNAKTNDTAFGAREAARLIDIAVRKPLGLALLDRLRGISPIVAIIHNDEIAFGTSDDVGHDAQVARV